MSMVKSRLRRRLLPVLVDVKAKSRTNSQYSEIDVFPGLAATKEQVDAFEQATDGGMIVTVTDVFWFEVTAGKSQPAIEEKHVLVDCDDGTRYEVVGVQDQGGQRERLRVRTRRLR